MPTFVSAHQHRRSPSTPATATSGSPALARYVIDGLLATIESYRAGSLPLHRFVWELTARIDTFAELDPPARVVTRLRWLHRGVELLYTGSTDRAQIVGHSRLSADEKDSLSIALLSLSTTLAALNPEGPLDPSGAARPAAATEAGLTA